MASGSTFDTSRGHSRTSSSAGAASRMRAWETRTPPGLLTDATSGVTGHGVQVNQGQPRSSAAISGPVTARVDQSGNPGSAASSTRWRNSARSPAVARWRLSWGSDVDAG